MAGPRDVSHRCSKHSQVKIVGLLIINQLKALEDTPKLTESREATRITLIKHPSTGG